MNKTDLTEWLQKIDLKNEVDQNQFQIDWFKENAAWLTEQSKEVGGVLLTNTGLKTENDFRELAEIFNWEPISYKGGNSPRTKFSGNVYTSTEWPADQTIPQHSELSYTHKFPQKIMFSCIVTAETGGETPLSSNHEMWEKLSEELKTAFMDKGVKYVRNLHGGMGLGPSWQDTFETDDKEVVTRYLTEGEVSFEWTSTGLHLEQTRPAYINHPRLNTPVWFNQVDEFHPSINGELIYNSMLQMVGNDPMKMPVFVCFGDGSLIPDEYIKEIRKCANECALVSPWEQGSIVLLDNLMVSHGRMPFTGDRKVLVTMGN